MLVQMKSGSVEIELRGVLFQRLYKEWMPIVTENCKNEYSHTACVDSTLKLILEFGL